MESQIQHKELPLTGRWITADPASIGMNFRTLKNLRHTDTHLQGIKGMSKVTSAVINATYSAVRSAFHFMKPNPQESHIIVQAYNSGMTASKLLLNSEPVPGVGDFTATPLWDDSPGSGIGRFSGGPDGQVIYANGVDTCIWTGDEMNIGACILSKTALTTWNDIPTDPKSYIDEMNNSKTDAMNILTIGGDYKTLLIGTKLPASGFKFYVKTANTTANTMVIKESTAGAWDTLTATTDGTRDDGKSFAQTGEVAFGSTVDTTKTKYLNSYYLYWYQFTINDGTADIYKITAKADMQPIIDLWDGVYRELTKCYITKTAQEDKTLNVLKNDYESGTASTYLDISSLTATTQFLEFGFGEKQTALNFLLPSDYVNTISPAAPAAGTISMGGLAVAEETFQIGDVTFTWKASRTGAGEVAIGADANEACDNIVAAVNADHTEVIAERTANVLITAVYRGEAGNDIDFTEDSTNMSMDGSGKLGGTVPGTAVGAVSVDYWDGEDYVTVGTVTDGTSKEDVSLSTPGVISWQNTDIALEQKKQYANAEAKYYYRVKFDRTLSASVRLIQVTGIPAPIQISHYKFPIFAQGRILLMCDMSGARHKGIASSKYMPQVYNGSDTADMYFGEEGELSCGVELFSQFGSSLYSLVLVFKNTEMWIMAGQDIAEWENNTFLISDSIGCPAPMTLKTVTLATDIGAGTNRALAIWQGAHGVYMSDGRAPIPVHGDIKEFFDSSFARRINPDMIDESVGFVDVANQEYHLLIATGASTVLDAELVYDIRRNKWHEVDRDAYPLEHGLLVKDYRGNAYNYGFVGGWMTRLEHGQYFIVSTAPIVHEFQFGDFPLGQLWEETRLSEVRLFTVAKTATANDITCTHYADTYGTGTEHVMSPERTGYRLALPEYIDKLNGSPFHTLKFSISTNNEDIGFEPLTVTTAFHVVKQDN